MALALPKINIPKLAVSRKQVPLIVGGVVVLAALGWFGWQYFEDAGPAPAAPAKPQPVTAAKAPAAGKAAAPADAGAARDKPLVEGVQSTSAKDGESVAAPTDKPAPPAAKPAGSKTGMDARACLGLATNKAIMACAEEYR